MGKTTKELKSRNEIPKELTWDLEAIFETDELWEDELKKLQEDIQSITKYQGKLSESAVTLYELFKLQDELSERLGKLYTYARMRYDEDTTNSFYQAQQSLAENLLTTASSTMSYIVPEILEMEEEQIEKFLKENKDLQLYRKILDEINRQRPLILSQREEELLAEASDPMQNASQTFSMLNNADLVFPSIKNEDGEEVDLTHGRYIGFMESTDRRVRKEAFKAMFDTYGKYINTFATTLSGNIKKDNFYAKVRNYKSARHAALDSNNIPEEVYDNLVNNVNDRLSLLHRYAELQKKVLKVDELHMYDMYTPLIQDVDLEITYEKAKAYVLDSLAPLGQEYVDIVKEG